MDVTLTDEELEQGRGWKGDSTTGLWFTQAAVERIVAARLAAVEALAERWEREADSASSPYRAAPAASAAALLRAAVRADPPEATT